MYSFYEFLESEKDSSVKSSILFTAVLIFANDRIVKDIYKIGVSEMSNYHFYIPNPYFTKSGNKTKNIFVLVNRRTEFGNRNKEEFSKIPIAIVVPYLKKTFSPTNETTFYVGIFSILERLDWLMEW